MTIKKKNDQDLESLTLKNPDIALWKQFVTTVSAHIDPVLASMLYATDLVQFDRSAQVVEVVTLKKFTLFQDLFFEQKHLYQQYLNQLFGFQATLAVRFSKVEAPIAPQPRIESKVTEAVPSVAVVARPKPTPPPAAQYGNFAKKTFREQPAPVATNERAIDVSDTKKWKITHTLLHHFGGTVREIIKDTHEFDA